VAELARGQITDRPWGLTFGQIGLRAVSGQLTVRASDGREYKVAFEEGAIVGATSPQPADAVTRIAMTSGLISSSQVANVARQIAATPEIDEIALLASACRLGPDQVAKLRRRVLMQRAARTFSVEAGSFVLEEDITIPTAPDAAVDVRSVVYQGARLNLSELRLVAELRALGSRFTLGETALEHAEWFGLDAQAMPVLDALRGGTTLPEIEARHREIDPRTVQSVIYALVACREVTATQAGDQSPMADMSVSFKAIPPAGSGPVVATAKDSTSPVRVPPANTAEQEFRTASGTSNGPSPARRAYNDDSTPMRTGATNPPPKRPDSQGGAPPVRTGTMPPPVANRAPAPPANAPRTKAPSSPPLRPRSPSEHPVISRTASASGGFAIPRTISQGAYSEGSDRVTQSFDEAGAAFKRGIDALQANQLPLAIEQLTRASTLNPHEFEHSAMLAFAQLAHAPQGERAKSADKVRKMLSHASQKSRDPAQALVYLGQLERLLGNDKQAVVHFRAALVARPEHPQAQRELDQIDDKAIEKSGFNLFKKK
jgi:hypothetical protein